MCTIARYCRTTASRVPWDARTTGFDGQNPMCSRCCSTMTTMINVCSNFVEPEFKPRYEHNCALRSDNRVTCRFLTFKPLVLMFKTTTLTIFLFETTILTILMFKITNLTIKSRAARSDNRVTCLWMLYPQGLMFKPTILTFNTTILTMISLSKPDTSTTARCGRTTT